LSLSLVDPALNASFNPRFFTDLELDWGFDTQGDQLKVPVIAFRNFSLDADSFMQGFLGDTVKGVQKFTKPMQPFIDMFEQPVPIVSSFDSSETMGDLFLKGAGLSEEQQDRFNTMVKIVKAVNTFDFSGTTGGAVINFGDILLTGDAQQIGQFFFDTTQLQGVIDDIMNSPALQEVQEKLETLAEYVGFNADAGFKYPLLENPGPVIGSLLTGQAEIMFSYATGRQHFELGVSVGVGIPGLLGFFLNAGIVFDASLSVGYDTAGLLKFIQDQRPESLLHGFYIDNSIDNSGPPIPNVPNPRKSSLYLQGHADISASVVATVSGGLYADIAFELASNSVSTRVYLDDIITNLSNNVKVFNPSGRLYAAANLELTVPIPIGPDITLFSHQLSYQELLSFNIPPAPTPTLPLTVIDDVTNQHTLLLDVTKMTAGGKVKVQPFHDYPITKGIGYLGDGIRVDYPNEIVMYVERKNDITTNYYNFVGLSGAVPDGVSIDIVDPFTVFTTEGAPDPQPPQTESGVLLAGGKSVVYTYSEAAGGSLATVLLVGGYGSNSLTGGTMAFGNFVPAARIGEAKNHFGNLTGFDAAGQAYVNARVDSVLAPVSPSGIIGATMTGKRGGLMFGGPGNNSFFATGPGAYEMVGGEWTNNFTISPSFGGVPATYEIDGGPFGQSKLVVRVPANENVGFENSTLADKYNPSFKALAVTANAGLSATAHGIKKVQIIAQSGSSVTLGDTSELNTEFAISGGAKLTFGGTNLPDVFDVSTSGYYYGLENHFPVYNYSTTTEGYQGAGPSTLPREADPIYAVTRTFGTNGRTQTIPFAVSDASASSIKLNAGGASDTYNITLGIGGFIDVSVDDTDTTNQNSLTVNVHDSVLRNNRVVLTDNALQLDYYTATILNAVVPYGLSNNIQYVYGYWTSAHYTPTVHFGANNDFKFVTAFPFLQTTVNRPLAPQAAKFMVSGLYDTTTIPYIRLGPTSTVIDASSQPVSFIDFQSTPVNLDVVTNGGSLEIVTGSASYHNKAGTYNVLGNDGTLSMRFAGVHGVQKTVNVAATTGVVNVYDETVGMPISPTVASTQVNVGSTGSLANVRGAINLTTPKGLVSLKIDDRTNPGPSTSWTVDALKTEIGDLTINYAGLNTAPFYFDNISTYDAFPKSGQVVNYNAHPSFKVRKVNGLTLANNLSIFGATQYQRAGTPVSVQLEAAPPNTLFNYSATGLPPGLTVNLASGLITGVIAPQAYLAGPFNATIFVTTGGAVVRSASAAMRWNVSSGIEINIPNEFDGVPGLEGTSPANLPLTAVNHFNRPLTFTATGLPPGITFNPTTNRFTGAFALGSAQNGPYHVAIHATDGFETADTEFDWNITGITLVAPPNQLNHFGDAVDFLVQATTATGAVPVLTVTGLPAGLSFNPATRRITGTVSTTAYPANQVYVTATNGADVAEDQFTWLALPVGVTNYISVDGPGNQFLHEGDDVFRFLPRAYNSLGLRLSYSVTGLPSGLSLEEQEDGYAITGTIQPGAAANSPYHVQLQVTDGIWSDTATFDITVAVRGSVSFRLDDPNLDQYNSVFDIVGFRVAATSSLNETITYSATGLPPGIMIDPQTGFIGDYFAPLAALPSRFQVNVTATAASGSDSVEFFWNISSGYGSSHIAFLPHPSGTGFVRVTSPAGTEISASISPQAGVALPNGVSFPFGFVTFAVQGLAPGQAADVIIAGLDLGGIEDYYKYGATPANATEHWYNFLFGQATDGDSALGTGMEIVGGNIVLHLIDGGRGDDDTSMNGVIFDIGGPALGVEILPSTIAGRRIFYNQSVWDGNDAAIDAVNDNPAIATDKTAYLANGTIANYNSITSFSRGITGIMVDLSTGGIHAAITASDFVFKVGNNNAPDSWVAGPAPSAISVVPGGGEAGSDRVIITWDSGTIRNTWLEVQVLANANTGLAATDVHFWGNKIADSGTGTPATTFSSTSTDAAQVFATIGAGKPITDLRDYNRDGQVTSTDAELVFANIGTIVRINIGAGGPFAPDAEPLVADDGRTSAVASALAARSDDASKRILPPRFAHRLRETVLDCRRIDEYFRQISTDDSPRPHGRGTPWRSTDEMHAIDDELLEDLVAIR
jgi:hypothetical protein